MDITPCMRCGACCACFQVAFPTSECDLAEAGMVPEAFTIVISPERRAMRGTEKRFNKRCLALVGTVGISVTCRIYASRPSTCHNFRAAWGPGNYNNNCDRARATYGLTTFSRY